MHGYRGRRNTEYGVRLAEKQKLRFHYCMMERQFRRFLDHAKKSKGNTASTMIQLLELPSITFSAVWASDGRSGLAGKSSPMGT